MGFTDIAAPTLGGYFQIQLAEASAVREFSASSYIYTSGQRDDNIYLIDDGLVKIHRNSKSGKSCILCIHSRGDIFGESSLLRANRDEAAVAMTLAKVHVLPCSQFMKVLVMDGMADEWARYMAAALQEQRATIALFALVDSQRRLAAVLLILASKIGIRRGDSTVIPWHFSQEELSQMVGTTRSRIGVFLKGFQRDGLVRFSRMPELIIDDQRLRSYLELSF